MRLKRRFEHMIKLIEARPGLINDCTHMVYLNNGYTHTGFGNSYAVKNAKELKDYMEEVIPTNENVIDIACLTQPVDFYNISKLGDVTLTYCVESTIRTLQTTGEALLNIFFNDPNGFFNDPNIDVFNDSNIDVYDMINLNYILKIESSVKTYIIHGYDISWWRNNLKRLDNGLRKLVKKEEVRNAEIKLIETDIHRIPVQDVSNWSDYDKSSKLEEQVKYSIASTVEEYCNIHYDNDDAQKETFQELLDRVYEDVTTTFRQGGSIYLNDKRLRYFGKKNIIELAKIYITNYSDVQDFIERGDK